MPNTDDPDDPDIPISPGGLRVEGVAGDLVLLSFPTAPARLPEGLSEAECDVARRVYAGESNEAIAQARGVSVKTINNQLAVLYRKLGVTSRIELTLRLMGDSA